MEKQHTPPITPSRVSTRPPACGNRMCDLCTETRCWMLRRETDKPPSSSDAPAEMPGR